MEAASFFLSIDVLYPWFLSRLLSVLPVNPLKPVIHFPIPIFLGPSNTLLLILEGEQIQQTAENFLAPHLLFQHRIPAGVCIRRTAVVDAGYESRVALRSAVILPRFHPGCRIALLVHLHHRLMCLHLETLASHGWVGTLGKVRFLSPASQACIWGLIMRHLKVRASQEFCFCYQSFSLLPLNFVLLPIFFMCSQISCDFKNSIQYTVQPFQRLCSVFDYHNHL
jgi:hypothetical protein